MYKQNGHEQNIDGNFGNNSTTEDSLHQPHVDFADGINIDSDNKCLHRNGTNGISAVLSNHRKNSLPVYRLVESLSKNISKGRRYSYPQESDQKISLYDDTITNKKTTTKTEISNTRSRIFQYEMIDKNLCISSDSQLI